MNLPQIEHLHPIFNSLGWTLLHFLWQGTLIAFLVWGMMILLRKREPNVKHLVMCAALVLMLLSPVFTFSLLYNGHEHSGNVDEAGFVKSDSMFTAENKSSKTFQITPIFSSNSNEAQQKNGLSLRSQFEALFPWIVLLWFAGVLLLSARLLIDWLFVQKLKANTAQQLKEWQPKVERLARRLGINKSIQLLESSLVKVPVTVGWFKPIILLPIGMVLNLTPQQVENIIAHELAHIRRHDYLVNIFQALAEILLFYHPAVLWLSKQIRIEREYACDDLAIKACGGDAICYARSLTKVERIRKNAPVLATAATGGSLESRVRRLVDASYRERSAGGFSGGLVFLLILAVAGLGFQAPLYNNTLLASLSSADVFLPENAESNESQSQEAIEENSAKKGENFSGEDGHLREIALSALGKHQGSVIIMHPKTGQLYTIVNQDLAFRQEWNPASTFKLVTSLAALDENKIRSDEKISIFNSDEKLNLNEALAVSKNDYFEVLGERVGTRKLLATARRFGLGRQTGVNLPGETAGYLPRTDFDLKAGKVGIYGQEVKITPMQLAVMVSALANNGTLVKPFAGKPEIPPYLLATLKTSPDSISQIVAGMRSAVEKGTGKGAFNRLFAVAGKTGTAETGSDGIGLFASFAPIENPQFVVVVAIKEPKANGMAASEIAGKIYDALGDTRFNN